MKRSTILFLFTVIFSFGLSNAANAQDLESHGQIMVNFGENFANYGVNEDVSGSIFARGTGFLSLRNGPLLFTYFGPEWTFYKKTNIKLLTGTFLSGDGGMSATASVWFYQVLPSDLGLFLEADLYVPIDRKDFGHEIRQGYTYGEFGWTPEEGPGIGLAAESFFSAEEFFEKAIGPTFNFAHASFWLAYDSAAEKNTVILRLILRH